MGLCRPCLSGSRSMNNLWVKVGISGVAVILIAVRLVWPTITIDGITIGLFVVALIPWLTSIVESLKLPGGWEIKLRDLSEAGQRITDAIPSAAEHETPPFLAFADRDPNLALVALRIEIEKRLRKLAETAEIPTNQPISILLHQLQQREVLNQSAFSGLREIILAGNQAAHGASVEPGLSDWAFSNGSAVLSALDSVLQDRNTQ